MSVVESQKGRSKADGEELDGGKMEFQKSHTPKRRHKKLASDGWKEINEEYVVEGKDIAETVEETVFSQTLLLAEVGSVDILDSWVGFQSRGKEPTDFCGFPDALCNFYFVWARKHTYSQCLR